MTAKKRGSSLQGKGEKPKKGNRVLIQGLKASTWEADAFGAGSFEKTEGLLLLGGKGGVGGVKEGAQLPFNIPPLPAAFKGNSVSWGREEKIWGKKGP